MIAGGDRPGLDPGASRQSCTAPTLNTERLIIRAFRADDYAGYLATMTDPDVMRHIGGAPLSREDAWRRMSMFCGFWLLQGAGMWAVERKADGVMIGHVGLFDLKRDMQPSIEGELEMGWIFDRSVHGHGFAAEAGRAVLDWADRQYAPASIPAIIAPDNAPSMRLAERLGFVRQADAVYKDEPIALFRRSRLA